MSNQTSSVDRARARVRRTVRKGPAYVFWASVFYAVFYTASVWYGSGGGADPALSSPFGLLWGVSMVVAIAGVARYLARSL